MTIQPIFQKEMKMKDKKRHILFLFALVLTAIFSISCISKNEEGTFENGKVEIMPVKDVKAGMTGYGLTVYKGAVPERFSFEVLGVRMMLLGPKDSPVIIAKLTTGPEEFPPEKTGVVAGMSGSPMYIDGKLIGALAYSFTIFAKDAICGIQPAELMLNPRGEAEKTSALNILDNKNIPLVLTAPANMINSFSERFKKDLFKNNIIVQSASDSSVGTRSYGGLQLVPGSSLGVYLVRGDVTLGATGTVTMMEGDKIYAFGHPLLGAGETEFPFHQNEIITINSSQMQSSKMPGGNVGTAEGTVVDDYYSAILGRIGKKSRMIAIKIVLNGAKSSRTINVEFVKSRAITLRLIDAVLSEVLLNGYNEIGSAPLAVKQKVSTVTEIGFGKKAQALIVEKSFIASDDFLARGNDFSSTYSNLLQSVMAILEKKNALGAVAGINAKISFTKMEEKNNGSAETEKSESNIADSVRVKSLTSKEKAIPGKTLAVDVLLSARKSGETTEYTITMPVPIPEDAKQGVKKIKISIGNGSALANEDDTEKIDFKETIAYYNNLLKPGLFLSVQYSVREEKNIKEANKNKAVEFGSLGLSYVRKITSKKNKKMIYAVPLPADLEQQIDFGGKKEKTFDIQKEGEDKTGEKDKKNEKEKKDEEAEEQEDEE